MSGIEYLTKDYPGQDEPDYTLDPEKGSVWISVKNLSIWILPMDGGVRVELMPKGAEADCDAIDSAYAPYPTKNSRRAAK